MDGKRYRGSTRCESKMAARSFEADQLLKIQQTGFQPQPSRRNTTLLMYSPRFKQWVEDSQQLRRNSKKYYLGGLVILSRSKLAQMPLICLNEDLIDTTIFTDADGQPGSPHLNNQALATLRRLLNKAKRWRDISEVPLVKLRQAEGRSAIITEEIERKILNALQAPEKNARVRRQREMCVDVFLLMHDSGLRTSEAVSIQVENIDWTGRRLFIIGGKSRRARRWVPLSDRVLARLQFRCDQRKAGWVFASPTSKTGHLNTPWGSFRKACRAAGVPDSILLYTGRHTFGTSMMRATGNTFAVADAMGHQDIKSMRPYQHHDTAILSEHVNRLTESRHTLRHTAEIIQ